LTATATMAMTTMAMTTVTPRATVTRARAVGGAVTRTVSTTIGAARRRGIASGAVEESRRRVVGGSSSMRATTMMARAEGGASSDAMTRVCAVEELPRGDRKLVRALGKSVLLFWYRDTVFAIESRSPAEGAYSEGFEKARLTQDACIECPTTKSKFDLKTGAIKEWYPENPVLAALTPQDTCRPMEVFPVEVRDDGIYLDAKNGSLGPDFVAPIGLGGANTSLENNNVFAVETQMYVEGEEGAKSVSSGDSAAKMDASQLGGLIAVAGVVAVGGTGACLYYENYFALGALWVAGFAAAAAVALKTTGALDDE